MFQRRECLQSTMQETRKSDRTFDKHRRDFFSMAIVM